MQVTYHGQFSNVNAAASVTATGIGKYRGQAFRFQPSVPATESFIGKYRGVAFCTQSSPALPTESGHHQFMYRGCLY
jgi:hypothetical protein